MQLEKLVEVPDQDPMRPVMPEAVADVISTAAAAGDDRLHDAFKWTRANHPLSLAVTKNFYPFWVVSKHADIRAFATRPDLFLSGAASITLLERAGHEMMREMLGAGRTEPTRVIVQMDAPDHPLYRAVVWERFTPREMVKLTDSLRLVAREFIDRLAATGGECDFAEIVSFPYPMRVIMSLLGVPTSDEPRLLKLAKQLQGVQDPDTSRAGVQTGAEAAKTTIGIVEDIFAYFAEVKADRLKNPRDDLATVLAQSEIRGEAMPTLESLSYYLVLATAGHDTTSAASGGGVIELARNPSEFAKVKADPTIIPKMVDEAVRWVSPSKFTMRVASQDVEFCGRSIKKGDHIAIAWVSGNRDEDVYDEPYRFKADRFPNRSVGFGWGPHVCIGQHLARLEMKLLFEEFFKRVKSVELTGEPRSIASFTVSGPKYVPIRFKMH
ncbi:MAG: cytochrome P450 [Caulobacterales bacterium]